MSEFALITSQVRLTNGKSSAVFCTEKLSHLQERCRGVNDQTAVHSMGGKARGGIKGKVRCLTVSIPDVVTSM